jgi:hypothetical protein
MMDGHCRDCRHWERDGEFSAERPSWGMCARGKSSEAVPDTDDTLAYGAGWCEYCTGTLVTAPDFGCVMFAARLPPG